MKNILITGVFGHIGFATALKLSKKYKVFGSYNLNVDLERKKILLRNNIKLIKNNFYDEKKVKHFLKKNKISYCVYCAGISHEIFAKLRTKDAINSNAVSLLNFLNFSKKNKFKLIYISTGSVFQNITSERKKIDENLAPTPMSIYSGSKRMGEILVQTYRSYFSSDATILRVSWVYGPEIITKKIDIQRGPIPYLFYLITKKKVKKISFNSGKNFKASFTYIDDVTNCLERMISSKKKFKNSIYQLSTGINHSNVQLAKFFKKIFKDLKINFGKGKKPWSNDSIVRGPMKSDNLFKDFKVKCNFNLYRGLVEFKKNLKVK